MNAFLKTFLICLIVTFSFLAYKYFAVDSFQKDLKVNNNPIFGTHSTNKNDNQEMSQPDEELPLEQTEVKKAPETKYTYTCYFYAVNGTLTPLKREMVAKPTLENTINLLLKGPTIEESKRGIYSEIPPNVSLISLKRSEKSIIVNLSSNFGNGGGTQSVENRVKQLSKTVKSYAPKKNIYLYINGKEVEYLGGEGVYIKQPLD